VVSTFKTNKIIYFIYFLNLKDPDGNQIQAKTVKNQDGTWKIEFSPNEIGI